MRDGERWLWLFEWFDQTAVGVAVRESIWAFSVIEAVHLLGLCLLGGALLVVDLRMLGLGVREQRISLLAEQLRPWLLGALAVMLLTGVPLFLSEPIKCYYNRSFWVKMTTLPVALAFTFTVRGRVARTGGREATLATRVTGAVSILLWFVVAAAGRWIGFS